MEERKQKVLYPFPVGLNAGNVKRISDISTKQSVHYRYPGAEVDSRVKRGNADILHERGRHLKPDYDVEHFNAKHKQRERHTERERGGEKKLDGKGRS